MSQATRPASTTKKKWPWVAGAAGGVILIAGAVNAGKSSAQNEAQTAPTVVTSEVTQTVPTTIVSTSVVTSALTQTLTAEPVTVTVTAPAEAAAGAGAGAGAVIVEAEVPAVTAPAPAPPAAMPSTTADAETTQPTRDAPTDNVSFDNCTEAWAAGAAPILRGEPGYAQKLDRNDDGVACEDPPR